MCEKNVQLADRQLNDVSGGTAAQQAEMTCPHCGAQIDDFTVICPQCQKDVGGLVIPGQNTKFG